MTSRAVNKFMFVYALVRVLLYNNMSDNRIVSHILRNDKLLLVIPNGYFVIHVTGLNVYACSTTKHFDVIKKSRKQSRRAKKKIIKYA